jgi:hypothetical protein
VCVCLSLWLGGCTLISPLLLDMQLFYIFEKKRCRQTASSSGSGLGHPDSHTLTNEVKIDLNALRTLILDRVDREVDDADVVAVDEGAPGKGFVELLEKLA